MRRAAIRLHALLGGSIEKATAFLAAIDVVHMSSVDTARGKSTQVELRVALTIVRTEIPTVCCDDDGRRDGRINAGGTVVGRDELIPGSVLADGTSWDRCRDAVRSMYDQEQSEIEFILENLDMYRAEFGRLTGRCGRCGRGSSAERGRGHHHRALTGELPLRPDPASASSAKTAADKTHHRAAEPSCASRAAMIAARSDQCLSHTRCSVQPHGLTA
jgi:hypothetical protein